MPGSGLTAYELMVGHDLWSKVGWASLLVAGSSQKHNSGLRSKVGSNPTGAVRNLIDSPAGISSGCSTEKEAMLKNGPVLLIFCTFSFLSGEVLHKGPFGLVYLIDLSWIMSQSHCRCVGSRHSAVNSSLGKLPWGHLGNLASQNGSWLRVLQRPLRWTCFVRQPHTSSPTQKLINAI